MRATRVLVSVAVAGLVVVGTVTTANSAPKETVPPSATAPGHVDMPVRGGAASGVPGAARVAGAKSGNGISYHGGPVMNAGVHAYVIWYGNWSGNTATSILPTLLGGMSGSSYYNINTTYYDGSKQRVPNSVTVSGQTTDAYSQGATNLSDAQIQAVVSSAIGSAVCPSTPPACTSCSPRSTSPSRASSPPTAAGTPTPASAART